MIKGFKECEKKYMEDTMHEFKKKKLKISGKRIVQDRKQAIAIGLNISQRKCKYNKDDLEKIKVDVNNFLNTSIEVTLSNIIKFKAYIKKLIKDKKYRKVSELKNKLILKIFSLGRNKQIKKNIFNELYKIWKL